MDGLIKLAQYKNKKLLLEPSPELGAAGTAAFTSGLVAMKGIHDYAHMYGAIARHKALRRIKHKPELYNRLSKEEIENLVKRIGRRNAQKAYRASRGYIAPILLGTALTLGGGTYALAKHIDKNGN